MKIVRSVGVAGLAWCVIAASAQQAAGTAHAKSAPGFGIERTPAWVQPVAFDPAAPVPSAPYQLLVADEQIRVQDGASTRYRHTLRRINDASALQQGGQIELDFDPSYQRLIFHKVDILRGNQRIDKLDPKKIRLLQREQQLERQIIDGRFTASLVLDDLRVGDRVEWSASVVGDNPVFGGRFVETTWDAYPNAPVGVWQLRVLAPAGREIRTRVGDPTVTSTSSVHDGVRETLFRHVNVPQALNDAHLPPAEFLKLQVELSEFADWHDVGAWAAQVFARAMQPTPAVDDEVAALKAQARTPESLLRATLDFVQRDIRYFGTETGIDSHQPASAETVLRQRFGDCKDKVALLATLLARMGFDATPVIVSARFQGASSQRLPGPQAFDHAIVRVMVDGRPVYLDATRSQQTGAIAAREALDFGWGLPARADASGLVALPSGRDGVRVEVVDTFAFPRLADEGTLTSVTTLHGDIAEFFRAALASQPRSEIEKAIGGETLRTYPSLVVAGPADFETVTEDNTVRVTSHYRTGKDFWTFPEQRALVARYVLWGLVGPLRLPDQAARTQPYRIGAPGRYLHHVAFRFGEPFPGAPTGSHFDEANAVFELHTRFELQSPNEDAYGELRLLADTISAADWQAHRDKVNKIAGRLGGTVAASPYSVAQQEALRSEGDALMARLRKGDIAVHTPLQATAYMRLLAYDKQLASDRLPPTLRAQVLLAKGVQLDNVGKDDEAKDAFEAASALDPANAEVHEALAANALSRGDDGTAMKEAAETLRLAPSRTRPVFIRGYAHYLAGDAAAARADFTTVLQSRDEVERGYGALWLYLATRRAGADGVQAVQAFEPTAAYPQWPFSVLQLMEGRIDFDAALQASRENGQRSASRECELYWYAGAQALADGDAATARKYLRLSVATGVTEFVEYHMAQRELARLGK